APRPGARNLGRGGLLIDRLGQRAPEPFVFGVQVRVRALSGPGARERSTALSAELLLSGIGLLAPGTCHGAASTIGARSQCRMCVPPLCGQMWNGGGSIPERA